VTDFERLNFDAVIAERDDLRAALSALKAANETLREAVKYAQNAEAIWHMSGDDRPAEGCRCCEIYARALTPSTGDRNE
jgi:hypothetical protein